MLEDYLPLLTRFQLKKDIKAQAGSRAPTDPASLKVLIISFEPTPSLNSNGFFVMVASPTCGGVCILIPPGALAPFPTVSEETDRSCCCS